METPGGSTVRAIARKKDSSTRSIADLRPISENVIDHSIHLRGSRIGSSRRVYTWRSRRVLVSVKETGTERTGGHETTRSDGRQTVARSSRERGSHSRIIRVIVGTNSVETTGSRVRRVSGSSTRDGSRLSPRVRADQQVDPLFSSPLLLSLLLLPLPSPCRRSLSAE